MRFVQLIFQNKMKHIKISSKVYKYYFLHFYFLFSIFISNMFLDLELQNTQREIKFAKALVCALNRFRDNTNKVEVFKNLLAGFFIEKDPITAQVDTFDVKLSSLEGKMEVVEVKLSTLGDNIQREFQSQSTRIGIIEGRLSTIEGDVVDIKGKLEQLIEVLSNQVQLPRQLTSQMSSSNIGSSSSTSSNIPQPPNIQTTSPQVLTPSDIEEEDLPQSTSTKPTSSKKRKSSSDK